MRSTCLTFLSLTAVCLLQTACTGEKSAAITAPPLELAAARIGGAVERPFKGRCEVIPVYESPTQLRITGRCHLTHLGSAAIVIEQTILPGPSAIAFVNKATYTAANGDELYSTTVGTATPNSTGLRLDGIETIIGGSGRFVNARGESVLEGGVVFTDPVTATGSFRNEGVLIY